MEICIINASYLSQICLILATYMRQVWLWRRLHDTETVSTDLNISAASICSMFGMFTLVLCCLKLEQVLTKTFRYFYIALTVSPEGWAWSPRLLTAPSLSLWRRAESRCRSSSPWILDIWNLCIIDQKHSYIVLSGFLILKMVSTSISVNLPGWITRLEWSIYKPPL